MRIITRSEVAHLLTMREALDAVEAGFASLYRGEVLMPQRLALMTPNAGAAGLHLSMPAFIGSDPPALSVKIVTVYPDNPQRHHLPTIQGIVLLHDAATGAPLALMDAEELTALRTGAATGVATRHLARADAASLLMIGAGALALHQVEAVCAVRPIQRVWIHSASGQRDAALCAQLQSRLHVEAMSIPASRLPEIVAQADIVCAATSASAPIVRGGWLAPGTHLNLVGAYARHLREVDADTIAQARVFVDRLEAARAEAGDIVQAAGERGVDAASLIAGELGAVVAGALPGRSNDREITLFKSVGLAMQDVVCAARVYQNASAQGIGSQIDLTR